MAKVLVTGGAGYIGSHTLVELIESGYTPVVVDSLAVSSRESIARVEEITGQKIAFHQLDVRNKAALQKVFAKHDFTAVIHFAGLKFVGESIEKAIEYYDCNLGSTLVLLEVMRKHGVKGLIFSSSSTVYGNNPAVPLKESEEVGRGLLNPYAKTKYMIEEILRDTAKAHPDMEITILRYFNPVGAHASGKIGENPHGTPANLLPRVLMTATGALTEKLYIHGGDYDTPDGTCLRDYIHVVDLAKGHVAALQHLKPGCEVYNLGTGQGTSVLEIIHAFEDVAGKKLQYEIGPRRDGDIVISCGNVDKANQELGWRAEKTIVEACADAWRWQSQNPQGFADAPS